MKFVFIDEFKPKAKKDNNYILYGLSAIVIDSSFYNSYRRGFEVAFKKLGWSKNEELKGRYVYSQKVFSNITIEKRISFAEDLFKLSSSKSGKNRVISVYVYFNVFDKDISEKDVYIDLLSKICKKIGRPINKKQGKNVIGFFLDNNDSVRRNLTEIDLCNFIVKNISSGWLMFEKPFFITSSNLSPGLVFADFVSYFHQNFLDTHKFFDSTKERFLELLTKKETELTECERNELDNFLTNYKKHKQTSYIITILKNIIYI